MKVTLNGVTGELRNQTGVALYRTELAPHFGQKALPGMCMPILLLVCAGPGGGCGGPLTTHIFSAC